MTTVQTEYLGASDASIKSHYDVGNDFWATWLDPNMVYSGALWEAGDDLAAAQLRKIDYYIAGTYAAGQQRVLDVGCGWGAVLRRLVGHHEVREAVGLTMSAAQREHIAERNEPRIDVRLENWIDHEPAEPYDAIISIGAFEHFANFDAPREEKVESYRRFFKFCYRNLSPGGHLGLQTISKTSRQLDRQSFEDSHYIWTHIFRETDVPWLTDICAAAEKRFDVLSVRSDGEHYVKTVEAWQRTFAANRNRLVDLVGEEITATYEEYLWAMRRLFQKRHMGLLRLLMRRA